MHSLDHTPAAAGERQPAPAIPEPPEGTFVCWFDPYDDPFTVFYRTDQHGEPGDLDRWYPAIQNGGGEVMAWADLLSENEGLRGPVELISNGELASRGGAR